MDFDRYGVTVGKKRYRYEQFARIFVCRACWGIPVAFHHYDPATGEMTHWAQCGECGGREFIDGAKAERMQIEAREVLADLPKEIANKLR